MTVQAVKAISVLGAVAATLATGDALADGHGHGYGPLRHYGPDYVYARVVDVDPVVRYVTVDRPRAALLERGGAPAGGSVRCRGSDRGRRHHRRDDRPHLGSRRLARTDGRGRSGGRGDRARERDPQRRRHRDA